MMLTGVWKKLIPTLWMTLRDSRLSGGSECRCGGNSRRTRVIFKRHLKLTVKKQNGKRRKISRQDVINFQKMEM